MKNGKLKKTLAAVTLLGLSLTTMAIPAYADEEEPEYTIQTFEHHYELQEDSYEATDTEGGYRHYVCADCGDEYSYETDPMVYTTNPKTGEPVDQKGAVNPLLPGWEHIPDGEPQVFWSKEDNEWRVYLYGSHDVTGEGYCGLDYTLWSAPVYDLSDWRNEGVILDISETNVFGAFNLFAPDCAYNLQNDMYYMVANEFNSYSVIRMADNPKGPYVNDEITWKVSVKGCYDPSIYIEDGTIYVAGSCMKQYYSEIEGISDIVAADGYSTGMSHIGVIYQLKEDLTDGDGIEATSWMKAEDKDYFPIFEGPSLVGYVDELGAYIYLYVANDLGEDGTSYNSSIAYAWTDDIMNGTWHYGNNNVEEVYPEADKVYSGNKGNNISDTSGRYLKNPETGELEFRDFATYVYGNNHGSMAKINGQWYFFGHRHTNAHTNSRQAIAGSIEVYTDDNGPVIEPMEFTASGIAGTMDAYETWNADSTTYLIEAVDHPAPASETNNPHSDCLATSPYIVATRDSEATHATYLTNLKDGTVIGYKYLDFGEEDTEVTLKLLAANISGESSVDVYLDAPSEDQKGTQIGTLAVSAEAAGETEEATDGTTWNWISGSMDQAVSGVHGVYFVLHSDSSENVFDLDQFSFSKG